MPVPVVKSYADKFGLPIEEVEKVWDEATGMSGEEYGRPYKKPRTDKTKVKNKKYYGAAMSIFKNKMNKRYGKKESNIMSFDEFVTIN